MLSENLKQKIVEVARYIGSDCTDWVQIKNQILHCIENEERDLFSRRHPRTKKHFVNDHDQAVIEFWEKVTGVRPFIQDGRSHDSNWVYKPKGWALFEYNRKRSKNEKT